MNENSIRKIAGDIIELWNQNSFKSKQHAKNKLKMAKWLLPVKTYNYLASKMGESLLPDMDSKEDTDIVIQAQKMLGGKIQENEPKASKPIKAQGKTVGFLEKDGEGDVFVKRVKKSKHLYRKIGINGAWGLDNEVIENLPVNCKIKITETEEQVVYLSDKSFFDNREIVEYRNFKGHGLQRFLPIEYFVKKQL